METPISGRVTGVPAGRSAKAEPKRKYKGFFFAWFLLIALGVAGTMYYSNMMKTRIEADITKQTDAQIKQLQEQYTQHIASLEAGLKEDISALETKVNSFNELLTFTKDSTNSKTDNSNQLYTQLQEVKKKLDQLQKNLEVLK